MSADLQAEGALVALRQKLGAVDACWCSPAKRCQETAAALFGNELPVSLDDRLWEQDFGDWDGLPFAEVPDVGVLAPEALAAHTPPGGESFNDVCARVQPALRYIADQQIGDRIAVIAHAGVVRAALAMATGSTTAALAFDVQTLSLTHIRMLEDGAFSIGCTNWVAPCQ